MLLRWLNRLNERRYRRLIGRYLPADDEWHTARACLPLLNRLNPAQLSRLRELVALFLRDKTFVGLQGLDVTRPMALLIAMQACLLLVGFPGPVQRAMRWYGGWQTVLVYPAAFRVSRTEVDEYGIAHEVDEVLAGESWEQAGVILSWEETEHAGQLDGYNLVIHEFAHKLDMRNGSADGFPPLPSDLPTEQWTRVFSEAFADFQARVEHEADELYIDPYATSAPAEFFAVFSEYFFEVPEVVCREYPQVYDLLTRFYRQQPLDGGCSGQQWP